MGRKNPIELEYQIIKLHKEGYLDVEIAREIGHCPGCVRNVRVKYGLKKNLTPRQKEIKTLFEEGKSIKYIADKRGEPQKNVRQALHKMNLLEVQKPSERECLNCGKTFVGRDDRAKYCCVACQKEASHKIHDAERRSRLKSAIVDNDISLPKLIKRDKSICYLCGKPVDLNDYKIVNGRKKPLKMYPTIDHVIPLIKGGSHSWDNVKLAHLHCNASKGANE